MGGNETSSPKKKKKPAQKKKGGAGGAKKKGANAASKSAATKSKKGGPMGAISEDAEDDGGDTLGFSMNKKLTINHFTFLKVVGKGSFGKVMQVRKNDDGKIYALKVFVQGGSLHFLRSFRE